MVGPDIIKKIRPRPKWIRQKVGYFALLVGALFAKIKVSGRWHLPRNGPYIIASNHFSYVDPAFFKYAVQKPISFWLQVIEKLKTILCGLFIYMVLFQLIGSNWLPRQLNYQKRFLRIKIF